MRLASQSLNFVSSSSIDFAVRFHNLSIQQTAFKWDSCFGVLDISALTRRQNLEFAKHQDTNLVGLGVPCKADLLQLDSTGR